MRKGSMTREELDAYNQGLKDAWERFNREYGHLVERDKAKKPTYKDSQFFCVSCGQELSIRGDYGYPFCRCGQRIDWK